MKLIIGLGNPGKKYQNTRHNLGFMVLDHFLEDLESVENTNWFDDKTTKSLTKKIKFNNEDLLLAKPITFMNLSGEAVKGLIKKYDLKLENVYIIYDELHIPFGHIKIRMGGGSGGHNGVQSIIDTLGTDSFLRIRIGIGPSFSNSQLKIKSNKLNFENYVLEKFGPSEIGELRHVIKQAIKSLKLILEKGIEKYMSKYNKKVGSQSIRQTQD